MSLVSSRLSLTHLVTIQRDASAGVDGGWGNPDVPNWQPYLVGVPCRAWATAGHETINETTNVVVEEVRLIVPLGTDVTEQDRLGDITHRGAVFLAGPTGIRAVLRHADHLDLVLVRIS
jgi:hypothetical protein